MTKEQQQTIERIQNMGLGYGKIGIALDLSRDKVRNYCKANGLDGYAKRHLQSRGGSRWKRSVPTVYVDNAVSY